MKEKARTWLTVAGVAALLAFAALVYTLYPGILAKAGVDGHDLGGGAVAALILWLVLRKPQPLTRQMRIILGVTIAVGLLLGLAVFSFS